MSRIVTERVGFVKAAQAGELTINRGRVFGEFEPIISFFVPKPVPKNHQ
jgi:hypothetical protein